MPALLPLVAEADAGVPSRTFRALVETHQRPVYALALDLTGNHHDAEDLSQEVFLKAYQALDGFRGEAAVQTWLYRITVNTYLNRRRKKALRFRRLWATMADAAFEQKSHRPPDRAVQDEAVQRHIAEALGRLSPRERSAFVLRHYHDLSVREVAAALGVAEGTVKSLLYRAVRKLREALACYRHEAG